MDRMGEVDIPILFGIFFGEINNNLEIFMGKSPKAFL